MKFRDEAAFRENLERLYGRIDAEASLSEEKKERIKAYFTELLDANRSLNLTAITEADEVFVKHLEDTMSLLPLLRDPRFFPERQNEEGRGLRFLDLGTGGGIPGLLLSVLLPESEAILADSLQKRIRFLEKCIVKLSLPNVSAVHGRAEELGRDSRYRDASPLVLARAVGNLPLLLEYTLPLTAVGGKMLAMKSDPGELNAAKNALFLLKARCSEIRQFHLSDGSSRCLFLFEKDAACPKNFPRRPGVAKKAPLGGSHETD